MRPPKCALPRPRGPGAPPRLPPGAPLKRRLLPGSNLLLHDSSYPALFSSGSSPWAHKMLLRQGCIAFSFGVGWPTAPAGRPCCDITASQTPHLRGYSASEKSSPLAPRICTVHAYTLLVLARWALSHQHWRGSCRKQCRDNIHGTRAKYINLRHAEMRSCIRLRIWDQAYASAKSAELFAVRCAGSYAST